MNTQVQEREPATATADTGASKGEVATFVKPRLPWHPAIQERFGVDKGAWKVLVDGIFPNAKTVDAIALALSYCHARKLDVFKKPVHVVPMWSSAVGGYVETIWPSIAELRITATRTGEYAGCDEAEFGPIVEGKFTGRAKVKNEWIDKTVEVAYPEWCRVTIYRIVKGSVCKFVGPKVKWIEAYATIGNSPLPNEMWAERPEGQLEKCAEAAALRRAFPEETGGELTAEEMHGRKLEPGDMRVVSPPPASAGAAPPDPDAGLVRSLRPEDAALNGGPPEPDAPIETADMRPGELGSDQEWLRDLDGALSGCEDMVSLGEKQQKIMAPMKGKVPAETWKKAEALALTNYHRITGTPMDAG